MSTLTKRVSDVEAALQAERAALMTERKKAHKLAQALKAATTLVLRKDKELE